MAEYHFKTVYFPKHRVRKGVATRVSLSLPLLPTDDLPKPFLNFLQNLDSKHFRLALGNPYLEDLEKLAKKEQRSISNTCLKILKQSYESNAGFGKTEHGQWELPLEPIPSTNKKDTGSLGVTFKDSLSSGAFGWYPYVEGFSASYAREALLRYNKIPKSVYDPFGGSGTVQLAASKLGINSYYSEVNPFMDFVAVTKVNSAQYARKNLKETKKIFEDFQKAVKIAKANRDFENIGLENYWAAFPGRDFFIENDLKELLHYLALAEEIAVNAPDILALLKLSIVSKAVACSNMTRRADLRKRKPNEYKNRIVNVEQSVIESSSKILSDIVDLPLNMKSTSKINDNARSLNPSFINSVDFVLTSPPYLNGTNYFRNTKIELWLLGYLNHEKDLASYRNAAVTAGINDVTKRESYRKFEPVEEVAEQLDLDSKDRRIPTMVRHYFSDMYEVLENTKKYMKPDAKLLLDIGDSKFYGVHVPTDKLLIHVAEKCGFILKDRHILARRMSRDKSDLVQVELVFTKANTTIESQNQDFESLGSSVQDKILSFQNKLPYKEYPFSKRNWGSPLHSLCSYQGKLKPSYAHWLVKTFVPKYGKVLDPIGGVGTIPFEASMQGMDSVSNDMSPFASVIARAKLSPPTFSEFHERLLKFREEFHEIEEESLDLSEAEFGLNASVKEYYHPRVLLDVLRARHLFNQKDVNDFDESEAFFWANFIHILHGNRPYALSRTSHPITPFAPSGPAQDKDAFDIILKRAERLLSCHPSDFKKGKGIYGDFRELPEKLKGEKFDSIITSPPFYGMRFDRSNWLRLWFCGWDSDSFGTQSHNFLERQQIKNINVYEEFFRSSLELLKEKGLLVLHLGSGGKKDMVSELKNIGSDHIELLGEVHENVESVQKHGINDKGLTKTHSLLIFQNNL